MRPPAVPAMCEHATALHGAEDDLARLRTALAQVTAWINNPNNDPAARSALAQHLGLPEPRRTP